MSNETLQLPHLVSPKKTSLMNHDLCFYNGLENGCEGLKWGDTTEIELTTLHRVYFLLFEQVYWGNKSLNCKYHHWDVYIGYVYIYIYIYY